MIRCFTAEGGPGSFGGIFRLRFRYEQEESGIPLRVVSRAGDEDFECLDCIDTGATACLFQREVDESLGLDIEAGLPQRFSTLTGPPAAFNHGVTMQVAGLT